MCLEKAQSTSQGSWASSLDVDVSLYSSSELFISTQAAQTHVASEGCNLH